LEGAAQGQRLVDEGVDFGTAGAMVNDGGPNGELAVDGGCGRSDAATFLEVDDDLRVDAVGVGSAIAETDDVELDRGQKFELSGCGDAGFQVAGQFTGPGDDGTKRFGAMDFEGKPGLEGVEAA